MSVSCLSLVCAGRLYTDVSGLLTDTDGSDSDAPPKRKKAKPEKKSPSGKSKKKVVETDDYDPAWGGSRFSKLACYAEVNHGPGGCTKHKCDFSHRPSICEAARKKKKYEDAGNDTDEE